MEAACLTTYSIFPTDTLHAAKMVKKRKLTINERVRSGMPVSFTQASITPWISAVMVEPEQEGGCEKSTGSKQRIDEEQSCSCKMLLFLRLNIFFNSNSNHGAN